MKPRFEQTPDGGAKESDAIRSNIEHTRERMDQTLDRIGERLTPRHILDEVLDYFRSHGPSRGEVREKAYMVKDKAGEAMGKAGDTAGQALHAITDAVRNHPIPACLIGAGLAWAVYERQREGSEVYYEIEDDRMDYDPESLAYTGYGGGYGAESSAFETVGEEQEGTGEKMKEKLSAAGEQLRAKRERMKQMAAEKGRVIRIKASELKQRLSQSAQHRGQQVAQMSDEHPLSAGLAFLAAGVLVGLAVPTTRKEDEIMGRASDDLKHTVTERGKEMVESGKKVATATVGAAKEAAQREGLTPEAMKEKAQHLMAETREKARHVVEETKDAAQNKMHEEGLTPEQMKEKARNLAGQAKGAAAAATTTQSKGGTTPKVDAGCGCDPTP